MYTPDFWNQRYEENPHIFGLQPSDFLRRYLRHFTAGSRVLLPADGEGRHGVFLAQHGCDVTSCDSSQVAVEHALCLAKRFGVTLEVLNCSAQDLMVPPDHFDIIFLSFFHLPVALRQSLHRKMLSFLRPGGLLLVHGFGHEQLGYRSGGPKDSKMLLHLDQLREDFEPFCRIEVLEHYIGVLDEGYGHQGKASLVDLLAWRA